MNVFENKIEELEPQMRSLWVPLSPVLTNFSAGFEVHFEDHRPMVTDVEFRVFWKFSNIRRGQYENPDEIISSWEDFLRRRFNDAIMVNTVVHLASIYEANGSINLSIMWSGIDFFQKDPEIILDVCRSAKKALINAFKRHGIPVKQKKNIIF